MPLNLGKNNGIMAEKVDKSKQLIQIKHIPKDAQVIMSVMKEVGLTEYDPRVISQLLEFTYRYITCILEDAKIYGNHAKKKSIDLDDVKLALESQLEHTFTNAPPRDLVVDTSRLKNTLPLPLIKPHCGVRLPQDKFSLSSCNLKLKISPALKKSPKVMQYSGNVNDRITKTSPKPLNNIIKRSGFPIVSRTQTINIPKPMKFPNSVHKAIAKPKINISQSVTPMVIDDDDSNPLKRKREDDDYDMTL